MTPGSGIGKKYGSVSGMNIPDHFFRSLEAVLGLKILKFLDADPDPGSEIFLTLDSGSGIEKSDPGSRINIPDPQHWVTRNN